MKTFLMFLVWFNLLLVELFGQTSTTTRTDYDKTFYAEAYGASPSRTDNRAAIQAALDAAAAIAATTGGRCRVVLSAGATYNVVCTLFTATSLNTGYGCLAMPSKVILDLNGSTLNFTGSGSAGDGAWIFPKGLHTNTTEYGAASDWEVRNGRLKCADPTDTRVGNGLIFSQCQNVVWRDLTIGPRTYHGFEIQAGKRLLIENVVVEAATVTSNGAPDIQFDVSGSASIPKNSGFTHTAILEDIILRHVKVSGFHPQSNGVVRRVEFGHSAGIQRDILFEDCEFDGIYGEATGVGVSSDRTIMDFNTAASGVHTVENVTVRRCRFHHDCAHGASSCIFIPASSLGCIARNILVEDCEFDGNFVAAVYFGTNDPGAMTGVAPMARTGLVARNCIARMGIWATPTSGGTYGGRAAGVITSGSGAFCFVGGQCGDVTFDRCTAILPVSFLTTTIPSTRFYYGFYIMNNLSTTVKDCYVQFWKSADGTEPIAARFYGARVDCDEVVTGVALPCRFMVDGFTVDTRTLQGVTASGSTCTSAGHWLYDGEPVTLDFVSGWTGITRGTTYFARDITANTFGLAATLGGAAIAVGTSTGGIIRKARIYEYCWDEDNITAGATAESLLTGSRNGIRFLAPVETGNTGGEIDLRMVLGEGKTATAAGTTGARTIVKRAGSVNFAAAATSVVVTNQMVTANSIITATVCTNDATMKSVQVVAGSGSFTLYANAAATAETRVCWRID